MIPLLPSLPSAVAWAGAFAYTAAGMVYSDGQSWMSMIPSRSAPFAVGNISGTGNLSLVDPSGANAFLGGTFRGPRMVVLQGPVSKLRFLFTNFSALGAAGPGAYTCGCSIEVGTDQATSVKYPLTFAGRLTTVIDPGGMVWSDPINLDLVAGDIIFPRTYLTLPTTGLGFRSSFVTTANSGEGRDYSESAPVDNRDSGTITAIGNRDAYGPVLAIGRVAGDRLPVIGLIGDSIITGSGESGTPIYRGGWAIRGLNNRVPAVQSSSGGATLAIAAFLFRGRGYLDQCDSAITAYGVNDVNNTVATNQANYIKHWRSVAALGPKLWQTTITPVSTSTDAWVTVANQTASADNTKRAQLNNWIRDGAPITSSYVAAATGSTGTVRAGTPPHPLTGFIELADLLESSRDSGLWKAGYTSDGTHPNTTGHIAGSAALADLSRFDLFR